MPGTSWLPIISFVVLRNSCALFRRYHSVVFTLLGQMSLETFILQFHIFLAADTKGTLSLGVFSGNGTLRHDRWRDLAFLLPVFLWLSWQVMLATRSLATSITQNGIGTEPAILPSNHGGLNWSSTRKAAVEEKSPSQVDRLQGKLPVGDLRMRVAITFGVLWCLNRLS
jgi:N-acetylneuraminate 9-O-acetyltransferase